jgi:ABC-2 type transport system permease protein
MSAKTLLWLTRETLWQTRVYLRDWTAVFFTFAFPVLLLLFWSRREGQDPITVTAFIAALGLAVAGYVGLAIGTASARETGLLKRIRSTPLPTGLHIGGRVLASGLLGTLSLGLALWVGAAALGLTLSLAGLFWLLPVILVGLVVLGSWGLLVGSLARTATAATYLTQATLFPIFLLSAAAQQGTLPAWAANLTHWLPLESLALLIRQALVHHELLLLPLLTLLAWGGLGVVLAVWRLARPL